VSVLTDEQILEQFAYFDKIWNEQEYRGPIAQMASNGLVCVVNLKMAREQITELRDFLETAIGYADRYVDLDYADGGSDPDAVDFIRYARKMLERH